MDKKEKVLAIMAYLWILALVPIVWQNKSETLKSHARSGIVMLVLWLVLLFVFRIPLIGTIAGILLLLAGVVFMVWGIFDAARGKEAKIPAIEKLADLFK